MGRARVAVGTPITGRSPHRPVLAAFPHTVPTLGIHGDDPPYASQRLCRDSPDDPQTNANMRAFPVLLQD